MRKSTTRDVILQEARKLFTTNGFASTSIREICAEAGVTAPVLYYHFGSKQGLFNAVVQDALSLDDFCSLLQDEVAAAADPSAKLRAYVVTYLTHFPYTC